MRSWVLAGLLFLFSAVGASASTTDSGTAMVSTTYYEDGSPEWERSYRNGKQDGRTRNYYPNGHLKGESYFAQGMLHGAFRTYNSQGALETELRYREDQLDGEGVFFYPGGARHLVVNFLRDRRHGEAREYYEDGRLKAEWHYSNGELEGMTRLYDPSGQVRAEALFQGGNRVAASSEAAQ